MIKFSKMHDVHTSGNNTLPVIVQSAEGKAMAHIPGWASLFDPAHIALGERGVLNRASGARITATTLRTPEFFHDPASGQPLIRLPADPETSLHFAGDAPINPEAWSIWRVFRPAAVPSRQYLVIDDHADEAINNELGLSIGYAPSSQNLTVYEYGRNQPGVPVRLSANLGAASRGLMLVMVTFSTREGLRIFDGGRLVASAPNDRRALVNGTRDYRWNRYMRGDLGAWGHLNVDLGWAEHSGYRRAIEQYLIGKYSIVNP